MKHVLPALLISFAALTPAFALDTAESRLQFARMAIALDTPRDALLSGSNPLSRQPMFQQVFNQLDFRSIDEQAAQMMADMFTVEEIKALITFKQSEVGQSIDMKMAGYQRLVGSMLQNEMKSTFERKVLPQQATGAGSFGGQNTQQRPATAPRSGGSGTPVGTPIRK